MDNRNFSTPISDRVVRLNEQRKREEEYARRGLVGEQTETEGYIPFAGGNRRPNRSFKLQRVSKISTVLVSMAIVSALLGKLSGPADVRFRFDYNTESVTMTQDNSDDYTTKSYEVVTQDGAHRTLSFDELDKKVPEGSVSEQMVSVEEGHVPVGVIREDIKSLAQGICNLTTLVSVIGGSISLINDVERSRKR